MKLRKFLLTAFAVAAFGTACYAQDVNVSINGNIVNFQNQKPVVVEGRTLIPLRGVFDNMGYGIDWNGETKTVTLTKGSDAITINIGESCYYLNGESHAIDVPAQIINGSTMLPLRAISDASGTEVLWDAETKIATIIAPELVDKEPITGVVTTNDQSESDFINSLTAINNEFNTTAIGFMDYFNQINTEGINSEEELQKAITAASDMKSAADTAIGKINALSAPASYQNIKTVSVEYMQLISDMAGAITDLGSGKISVDEYMNKLNTIGTQLALKEVEYQNAMKSLING